MISRATPIRLTPLLAALALAGCAIGPDYQRPASSLPESWQEAPKAEASVVDARWWTLFNDETLNGLVDQALARNADLRQAVARVEQAEAVARESGAVFLPEIDGTSNISNTKVSTSSPTYFGNQPTLRHTRNAMLTTSYELDIWGRVRRANEMVRADLLASEYGRDAIRLSVAGLVAANYLALRSLDAQLAVSDETLKSREESLRIVKVRVDAGLSAPIDGYQAETQLAAARAQLASQRKLRAQTEHMLALLTANPSLKVEAGDIRQLPLPPVPPAGLPSELIEARPDIRQAEQALVSSNAGIGLAKAGYFPKFTLTGNVGTESRALSDLFSAGTSTWSLGLGLFMPILDYGRTTARVDQAKAVNKQSLAAWDKALQTAYKEVRDALVGLREEGEVEAAQQARVDNAKKTLDLARLRYKAGETGYLEVLDAERTVNDAMLSLVASRQTRLAASVDLFKALGGGWKADKPAS